MSMLLMYRAMLCTVFVLRPALFSRHGVNFRPTLNYSFWY